MQNPQTELTTHLLPYLLTTDTPTVSRTIEKYLTPDATFHHPFIILTGRDRVKALYTTWSKINYSFPTIVVNDIYTNKPQTRITLDITYEFTPILLFGLAQKARVITILHLRRDDASPSPVFRICRQEDYYPPDYILSTLTPRPFASSTLLIVQFILKLFGFWTIYVISFFAMILNFMVEAIGWKRVAERPGRVVDLSDVEVKEGGTGAEDTVGRGGDGGKGGGDVRRRHSPIR
ncbi:hypothetical protein HK097_006287 [Rhizophlyctis rosea]|uniref:SigF-like NTF2-like domain-containing protein n=1 Tax=Rhizophlyctis rosea TaxID=64517 RepID=A0AAD5WYJ8_9FUNG|nr:hypothetical protein HK097_006287 [Rhizophlyctis rosea]